VNILLIQLRRIGDLTLTTPAIAAVRETFPDAKITLAVSREGAELLPAISGVDRALVMQRGLRDAGAFFTVARNKFEYCIDFTRNDRSALLALLSRARKRIVSYRVKRRSKIRRGAYNEFVQHRMRDMHTIDYNLSLLEPAGIKNAPPNLKLNLPESSLKKADELRNANMIGEPFVIFHPGSAREEKFWGSERWAEVIEHLRTHWRVGVALTGGHSELEQTHLSRIKGKLSRPDQSGIAPVVDLSGQTDLLTLAALIARARLLVTVDSAPMHLAAATRRPQVVLFGPTNPFHWHPRESATAILQGDSPAPVTQFLAQQNRLPMKLISTQAVINAMDSLLSTPAAQA
jgi:predicted lipopolysaccharide heptosyltransferase III